MSNKEPPFTPGPDEDVNDSDMRTHGKIIPDRVFLSRLARRQAELPAGVSDSPIIEELLGALESIGLDPTAVAPDAIEQARATLPPTDAMPDAEAPDLNLEELALEQFVLNELRASGPTASSKARGDSSRRSALLRLATRLNPGEIAAEDASSALAPDAERALHEGQEAGTRRALRDISRRASARRRGNPPATRHVAEDRTQYQAGRTDKHAKRDEDRPSD